MGNISSYCSFHTGSTVETVFDCTPLANKFLVVECVAERVGPSPSFSVVGWHQVVHHNIRTGGNGLFVGETAAVRDDVLAFGAVALHDQRMLARILYQERHSVVARLVDVDQNLAPIIGRYFA